jgi:hypothetical protein
VTALTEAARQAPLFALHPGEIDRSQWIGLLEPVTDLLRQRGLEPPSLPDVSDGRTAPELGIEL